jgi:hypothetical protein
MLDNFTAILLPLHVKMISNKFHSVLCISFAHNKGGPPDINIAQILHLSNFFELIETYSLYSFASIVNQKSVRYSVSI